MRVCSSCGRCFPETERNCVIPDHPSLTQISRFEINAVPGYRIEAFKGTDGPVERFLAAQTDTNVKCVINFVSLNGSDAAPFLKESKSAASLIHPSVVDVYDSGISADGDAYFVTAHPESRSLRDMLNEGIPPLLSTIRIIRETAGAIHALHSAGITHGALRPDNVLLSGELADEHIIKIQNPDFGGAVCRAKVSNKLTIDSEIDSLRYFAPEQFASEVATPKTDVYALGVLLFEMLAGQPPFDGENAADLIDKVRNVHAPEIKINNFDLRMLLTHALMQSLQKQAAFRQPTALAFARQIRHIEQLATHSSTPPVPFPAAIPQKRAAAAAAGQSVKPQSSPAASRRKSFEITNVKKLDLALVKPVEKPLRTDAGKKVGETTSTVPGERPPQADSTGDLNRSRLHSWREKYQAVTNAIRPVTKGSIQQLSLSDVEPQNVQLRVPELPEAGTAKTTSAPPPTRIKVEWDQPIDDLPNIEQVRKQQVQDLPLLSETAGVEQNNVAIGLPQNTVRTESQLFASYEKRPRTRRKASAQKKGSLRALLAASLSAFSMKSWLIAGGSAAAVIAAVYIGSSLLAGEQAGSARAENTEARPAPHSVEKPEPPKAIVENASVINEADEPKDISVRAFEVPNDRNVRAIDETTPSVAAKQQPPAKASAPDAVSNSKPKPGAAPQTQAGSKPAQVKVAAKPALTPSTLVISPGNGKVKSKIEPGNGSAFTRPRIVANPKP